MTNQIVPQQQTSALAEFGGRDAIREMADRLQKMLPGAAKFTPAEALTVAQVAIAHRLDPFNGEVWGLKAESGQWYGVMVGIKGLRKHAREQMTAEGGVYWTELQRIDPAEINAEPTAIAYRCIIRDTVTVQAWGRSVNILTTAGVPYADAVKMLGPAPQTIGHGTFKAGERSKMPPHQCARKRAEADAIRQRFDVRFMGADVAESDEPGEIIDAQAIEYQPEPQTAEPAAPAPKPSQQQLLNELGFGS